MRSSTSVLFASIAIVAGLALLLATVEAGSRFVAPCAPSGIAHNEMTGWRLTKNQRWQYKSIGEEAMDVDVSTNSSGFRDGEHTQKKELGQKRILFLGDSYTAGLEYPTRNIFTQRFLHGLRQTKDSTTQYDIMNVAVPAWGTDQQYLYLKNEGMMHRPDYVILMIAPNDIRESYGKRWFSLDGGRLVQSGPNSIALKDKALWFLANHSCAFHYWQDRTKSAYGGFADVFRHFPILFTIGPENASEKHLFLRYTPEEITKANELFKALILAIERLCKENGAKLLLSVVPTKIEYDETLKDGRYQPGKVAADVKALAAAHAIPFLDLVDALAASEPAPLKIFIAGEYHLNAYGHSFVADRLVPFFTANQ